MKRTQLIEAGILVSALIFGFKFFEGIITLLLQIVISFQYDTGTETWIPTFIMLAIYAVIFILLIRKSSHVAKYLGSFSENTSFPLKISKRSILHIVLITLGLITILKNIAEVLVYLYESFKNEVGRSIFQEGQQQLVNKDQFTFAAVQTVIALIIIYFSKTISNWFLGTDPVEELTLESEESQN